mgnify:CR=1 FL=1
MIEQIDTTHCPYLGVMYKVASIDLLDDSWTESYFMTTVISVTEFVNDLKEIKSILKKWPFGDGIFIKIKNGVSELFAVKNKKRYLPIPNREADIVIKLCAYDSNIVDLLEVNHEKKKKSNSS